MTDEVERLREALAAATQLAAAQAQRLREQDLALSGIASLNEEDPGTLIAGAFALLSRALDFDRAMFLEPRGETFVCIASTDPEAVDASWRSGAFFSRVAAGRAAVVPDEARVPEWTACDYAKPLKGAIYAPISAAAGPGLLVLGSRIHGAYSAADLAVVARLGIFVSQTLATTQRRKLSEAARQADQERRLAVEANEAKSQFLANMSHEIRTPLNGVTTVAALLADSGLEGRQGEMASLILESSRALEALLNDVLDLAKIESGQLSLETEPFHLVSALTSTFDLFAIRAQERGLAFDVSVQPATDGWFEGDAGRLRQIAANLLSNAVKFTLDGGVAVRLGLEQGCIVFAVKDTGVGIAPDAAARLFQRFEQADSSVTRRFGGSGLGLSVSQSLARMMNGDIGFTSTPGEGSEFVLRFPAIVAVEPASARKPATFGSLARDWAPRILVAEDNANNRKIVGMVLDTIQATTVFVENGAAALECLARQSFDVVLMDLQMPVMDGLTAIRRLRAQERALGGGAQPIIALSANAMTHHVLEALTAGADAHVAKPIDPTRLIQEIFSLAGRSGESNERSSA